MAWIYRPNWKKDADFLGPDPVVGISNVSYNVTPDDPFADGGVVGHSMHGRCVLTHPSPYNNEFKMYEETVDGYPDCWGYPFTGGREDNAPTGYFPHCFALEFAIGTAITVNQHRLFLEIKIHSETEQDSVSSLYGGGGRALTSRYLVSRHTQALDVYAAYPVINRNCTSEEYEDAVGVWWLMVMNLPKEVRMALVLKQVGVLDSGVAF